MSLENKNDDYDLVGLIKYIEQSPTVYTHVVMTAPSGGLRAFVNTQGACDVLASV